MPNRNCIGLALFQEQRVCGQACPRRQHGRGRSTAATIANPALLRNRSHGSRARRAIGKLHAVFPSLHAHNPCLAGFVVHPDLAGYAVLGNPASKP
jgi:hypothetical protein